jgi:hypothetical protein
MIRTCMGEMDETPEMRECAGARPNRLSRELTSYLDRLRARGMADADLDPSAASALLMGALFGDAMGREMMPEAYTFSVEEAPEKYVTLLLRGIGAVPRIPPQT